MYKTFLASLIFEFQCTSVRIGVAKSHIFLLFFSFVIPSLSVRDPFVLKNETLVNNFQFSVVGISKMSPLQTIREWQIVLFLF